MRLDTPKRGHSKLIRFDGKEGRISKNFVIRK